MAIKKISEFAAGAPTSEDKILFEQNGKGRVQLLAMLEELRALISWRKLTCNLLKTSLPTQT